MTHDAPAAIKPPPRAAWPMVGGVGKKTAAKPAMIPAPPPMPSTVARAYFFHWRHPGVGGPALMGKRIVGPPAGVVGRSTHARAAWRSSRGPSRRATTPPAARQRGPRRTPDQATPPTPPYPFSTATTASHPQRKQDTQPSRQERQFCAAPHLGQCDGSAARDRRTTRRLRRPHPSSPNRLSPLRL